MLLQCFQSRFKYEICENLSFDGMNLEYMLPTIVVFAWRTNHLAS